MLQKQKNGQSNPTVVCQKRREINPSCCSKRNALSFAKTFKPPLIGPQKDFCTHGLGHGIPVPNCELGKPVTFIYPKNIFFGIEPAKKPGSSPQLKNWKKWCAVWNSNQSAARGKNIPPAIMTSGEGWRRKLEDVELVGRTIHEHHIDGFYIPNTIYPDTIGPDKECSPGVQETLIPRYYKKFPPMERIRIPKTIRKEMHLPLRHTKHDATSETNEQYWKWDQNWKNSEYLQETKLKLCQDIYKQGPVPPCPDRLIIQGKHISKGKGSKSDELGLPNPIPELIITPESDSQLLELELEVPPYEDKRGPVLFIDGRTFQVLLKKKIHAESEESSTVRENQFLYDTMDGFEATTTCKEVRYISLQNQGTTVIRYLWLRSPPSPAMRNLLGNPGKMLHSSEIESGESNDCLNPNELNEAGGGDDTNNLNTISEHLTSSRTVDPGLTKALKLMRNSATAESAYENLLLMLAFRVPRLKRLLVQRTGKQLKRRLLPVQIQQLYLELKQRQRANQKITTGPKDETDLRCKEEYGEERDLGECDIFPLDVNLCPCQTLSNDRNQIKECHCADPTPEPDQPEIQHETYGCDYRSKEGLPNLVYDYDAKDYVPTRLPPSASMMECQEQALNNSEQKKNGEEKTAPCDYLSNEGLPELTYDYATKDFIPTRTHLDTGMTECLAREGIIETETVNEKNVNVPLTSELFECIGEWEGNLEGEDAEYEMPELFSYGNSKCIPKTTYIASPKGNIDNWVEGQRLSVDESARNPLEQLNFEDAPNPDDEVFRELKGYAVTRDYDPDEMEVKVDVWLDKEQELGFGREDIGESGERAGGLKSHSIPLHPTEGTYELNTQTLSQSEVNLIDMEEFQGEGEWGTEGRKYSSQHSQVAAKDQEYVIENLKDPCFDFHIRELPGVLLPGQSTKFPIIFRPRKPGLYYETLYLVTHPRLCEATYAIRLNGICMDPDLPKKIKKASEKREQMLKKQGCNLLDSILDKTFYLVENCKTTLPFGKVTTESVFYAHNPALYYHHGTAEKGLKIIHQLVSRIVPKERILENHICPLNIENLYRELTKPNSDYQWANLKNDETEELLKEFNQCSKLLIKPNAMNATTMASQKFNATFHSLATVICEITFDLVEVEQFYETPELVNVLRSNILDRIKRQDARELRKKQREERAALLLGEEEGEEDGEENPMAYSIIYGLNQANVGKEKESNDPEISIEIKKTDSKISKKKEKSPRSGKKGKQKSKKSKGEKRKRKEFKNQDDNETSEDLDQSENEGGKPNPDVSNQEKQTNGLFRPNQVNVGTQKDLDDTEPEISIEVKKADPKISKGKDKSPRSGKKGKHKSKKAKSERRKQKELTDQDGNETNEELDVSENEGGDTNPDVSNQEKLTNGLSRASQTEGLLVRDYDKEVEEEFNRLQKLRQHQAKRIIFENVLAVGIERMMCVIDNMNHMHQYKPSDYITPEHQAFNTC